MLLVPTAAVLLTSLVGLAASSSFILDDGFKNRVSGDGRSLLQTQTACPVSFQDKNYTIITSKCKGPRYLPQPCCEAFKEFACPYASMINDLSNDCRTIMFTYINNKGGYPPGVFASLSREDKEGLSCSAINIAPQPPIDSSNTNEGLLSIVFLACGVMLEFLFFFLNRLLRSSKSCSSVATNIATISGGQL